MTDPAARKGIDNAIFKAFTIQIFVVSQSIGNDKGEWAKLAQISLGAPDARTYAKACHDSLWTNGLDQSSWALITQGAATALSQSDHDATVTVLTSYLNIVHPSHNGDQWNALRKAAYNALAQINTEPFQIMMVLIRQLADGVTTDDGEWAKFGEICNDAAGGGIRKYIARSAELWTNKLDQATWTHVKESAAIARGQNNDQDALVTILLGFLKITAPSHNADQWGAIKSKASELLANPSFNLFGSGADIQFNGTDTRDRRLLVDPDTQLPSAMSMSFLIRKNDFPAHYVEPKACHVEYFMRLDQAGSDGSAYFVVTHSQDNGGYVGLAKVPATAVGPGAANHKITVAEPGFAGDMVWYDFLDASHVAGCNHPGNGGQIGSKLVLVGQDWTKAYGPVHAVEPVRKGSKVLFYDFAMLGTGALPTMRSGATKSNAFVGFLTTEQLQIDAGDDGEISTVLIEQGPDGNFYMIGANRYQTVLWTSPQLVPDINSWTRMPFLGINSMEDGSAMLAWAKFGGAPKALYYVKASDTGMTFTPLKYHVSGGKVTAVLVGADVEHHTTQSSAFKGDESWVFDDGSIYAGSGGGIALYGAYKKVDDIKGPPGNQVPCIQVRAWYTG